MLAGIKIVSNHGALCDKADRLSAQADNCL